MIVALMIVFAHAFIPPASTVFERVLSNQGSGTYSIEQDLLFTSIDGDSITVHENWTVFNNTNLYLRAEGKIGGTQVFTVSYNYLGAQKQYKDSSGKVQQIARPQNFYFDLFFTTSKSQMINRFKGWKILPSEDATNDKPSSLSEITYDVPHWQRISRKNGQVAYKFSLGHGPDDAAVWVAQDEFYINAIRLPTGLTIQRSAMEKYPGGMKWPGKTQLQWHERNITVDLSRMERLGKSTDLLTKLRDSSSLKPPYYDPLLQPPLAKMLKEFYSRVR